MDATTKLEDQIAGLGIVIRDSNGKFVAAGMQQSKFYGDVMYAEAEAEAARLGMEIAEQVNCLLLILEIDAQEIVSLALNKKGSRTNFFWIISEIQDKLKSLRTIKFQHVVRNCNSFAHSLAKLALENMEPVCWMGPPQFLYLFNEFSK